MLRDAPPIIPWMYTGLFIGQEILGLVTVMTCSHSLNVFLFCYVFERSTWSVADMDFLLAAGSQ